MTQERWGVYPPAVECPCLGTTQPEDGEFLTHY